MTTPRPETILIVDDDPRNLRLLQAMMSTESYHIEAASCGETALERMRQGGVDLVLLDAMMPGITGYEVTAELKGDPSTDRVPVIVVTADATPDALYRALEAGADEMLRKPVERRELLLRVRNMLRTKRLTDALETARNGLEGRVVQQALDLDHHRARWQTLFDASSDGLFVLEQDGQVVQTNNAGAVFLGLEAASVPGRRLEDVLAFDHDGAWAQAVRRMDTSGPTVVHAVRRDSTAALDLEISLVPVVWELRPRLLAAARDITARRKMEAQLRQAGKLEAIGRLAGSVAHDFNNLLTIVTTSVALGLEGTPAGGAVAQELHAIGDAAAQGARLTGQLLSYARREMLAPRSVSVRDTVRAAEPLLRRLVAPVGSLDLLLDCEGAQVRIDPGHLEQIIMNLVVNAVDALAPGGRVRISTATSQATAGQSHLRPGSELCIEVSDTGSGIPPDVLARIFEPFFSTKGQGTGLGLATVRRIVEDAGGTIHVRSRPGHGTAFQLRLPLVTTAAPQLAPEPGPGRAQKILLVDDQPRLLSIAARVLRKLGYEVVAADGLASAVTALDSCGPFDLLLSDVCMPGGNGADVAREAAARFPTLPVLFMTGFADDPRVSEAVAEGHAALLRKPFTPASLASSISEALAAAWPVAAVPSQAGAAPRGVVLVVDDEPRVRAGVVRVLSDWRVLEAATVREAVALIRAGGIDAVVCDHRLPDGTSLEVLGALTGLDPAPPFVLTTGAPLETWELQHAEARGVLILPKPFHPPSLRELLDSPPDRAEEDQCLDRA